MTNAELALLTILAEGPRHGYDIERAIEERGMREWTEIGFSSIYFLLKKLGRAELIDGKIEETSHGPARKVYHLTAKGRAALRKGVLEALSTPARRYAPMELGLANLPHVSKAEALAALATYRDTLETRRAYVEATLDQQRPLPYFVEAMFTYGLVMAAAESKWLSDLIERVEKEHDHIDRPRRSSSEER